MSLLTVPLKRFATLLVAVLATAAVTLTMLVAAPEAQAGPYNHHLRCTIAQHRVHRGDHDPAHCIYGPHSHSGVAYVVQKERQRVGRRHHKHWKTVWKLYVLGKFHTNRFGTADVDLHIPQALHLGGHKVHFKVRHQFDQDWIKVVRG
ncbi:MAG TPA: hypothetical protein VFH38_01930 [Jatrophihabitans sp.]|nr:hypothetical protein [Jatrophihabitans sp.]